MEIEIQIGKAMARRSSWFIIPLVLAFAGCKDNFIFDQNLSMPERQWSWQEKGHFKVSIEDTSSWYALYVNTRITKDYPFSNLWVIVQGISPSGDTSSARLELTLFQPDGTSLGQLRGTVFEYRLPVIPQMDFTESGEWMFTVEQNMRINTLPGVLDIGLGIEKTGERF